MKRIRTQRCISLCLIGLILILFYNAAIAYGDSTLGDILNLGHLPYLKDAKSVQISSYDTTGGNGDCKWVGPGQTLTIADIKGPGAITHIWVTISAEEKYMLRNIILKMYWDNEPEPSVLTPIGDFFGVGFAEYKPFSSLLVGMTSGGYYSYIPMPFRKSAKIQITNLMDKPIGAFYYHIDYYQVRRLDRDVAYFHAQWRRENPTTPKKDYTILDATGRGHYLGTVLSMQSLNSGKLWFLEGDEHVVVDGEPHPSWTGTGTEDYFISGWYFNQGTFASLFHGLTIKDEPQSKISAYRFHVWDSIPFTKSLQVSIEHGTENGEPADYSSLAYWYQTEPHHPFTLPDDRNPRNPFAVYQIKNMIEAESLVTTAIVNGGVLGKQGMGFWSSDTGSQWSGSEQAFYHSTTVGNSVTYKLSVTETGKYNLLVYFTQAPDYGIVRLLVDDKSVGKDFDGYNKTVIPSAPVSYGPLELSAGDHDIKFEIIDRNTQSTGYLAGFDGYVLEKLEQNNK